MDLRKHVIYLQFAGDFRESLERFARGEPETYFGQQYSVNEVVRLSKMSEQTTVVCCLTAVPYDFRGPEGIRTIGLGISQFSRASSRQVIRLCQSLQPTHAVVRFPNLRLLSWLLHHNVAMLPVFADSINTGGIRTWLRRRLLARILNSERIPIVANHQLNACRNLQQLGVDPRKLLPYDWPLPKALREFTPKKLPDRECWQLLYCGALIEEKGIGDVLKAVAILRSRRIAVKLKLLGDGEIDRFRRLAIERGIGDICEFPGRVSHESVISQMRTADIVLVPSHHSYPEGLPCTIREALMVHTPLIVTDHPMFTGVITDRVSGLIVLEKSPQSIAEAVVAYMMESGLYELISHSCSKTSADTEIPLLWGELIEKWLEGSPDAISSLLAHSLANGQGQSTEESLDSNSVGVDAA